MDIILASTLLVTFAEIGDKTMLLAILLAVRFRRPGPVIAGIFVATIGFLAMAAWTLVPDSIDEEDAEVGPSARGAFLTTVIAFFAAEMGDKTQIATIALGAQYQAVLLVAIGTTLGMMLANVPAVFLGERMTRIVPLHWMRMATALLFALLGLWALWDLLG